MAQLRRLTPYCQIGLWLVIISLCMDFTLRALDGASLLKWIPKAVTGTGYLEDSRLRVAQTLREYQENRIGVDEHLAAIVGISETREGIDLSVMSRAIGPQWRLLGLGGAGFGMGSVQQYANLVAEGELRPDVVILGLSLMQLVDYRAPPGKVEPTILERLLSGNFRSVAVLIRDSMWMYARREDISVSVEFAVLELRSKLLAAFGVALPDADAHKRSPWREMIKTDWPDHFSAETFRAQEEFYEDLGMFDLGRYEDSPVAISKLLDIIRELRRREATVVLVLMPQHSTLNRRIPPEALNFFQRRLGNNFPGEEPAVLDFRASVDDGGFVDLPHMNRYGRREFSQKLGNKIRELRPNGTPLMARR